MTAATAGYCRNIARGRQFAASMLALALAACSPGDQDIAAGAITDTRGTHSLIRLSDSDVRSLDPQAVSDLSSLRVAADQFAGLTQHDAQGQPIPALARGWTTSADGRIWTFRLRADARFSDGQIIDAHTLAKGFARLRDPATASPAAGLFAPIRTIRAADASTVVVQLNHPFPELPALLAHPAVAALPLHRIARVGDAWTADRPLVTSGPYRTMSWRLNDRLELGINPLHPAKARLTPTIVWQPVDDPLTALRLFRSGAADTVSDFPANRTIRLRADLGDAVRVSPYLGSYYLAFNTRRPPFNDVRVRRALTLATDQDWIARMIVGAGAEAADGVVPPALRGGARTTPRIPAAQRMAQARALLHAAGYGPERPLVFDIRFNSSAEHRRIAVVLATMWRPLGVEARLFNSEAALHFASLRRGDFALARSGWIADVPAPENFLSVHRSDAGPVNYSGFTDPRYDALLRAAEMEGDPAARAAKMRAAEDYLMAQAPVLPIYHYASRTLVAPRVIGWQDNAANIHPSATLRRAPAQRRTERKAGSP